MSLLSKLFGSSGSRNTRNDDYVSKEDYDEVQRRFSGILDAQVNGDDQKAERIWDSIKNGDKDCDI